MPPDDLTDREREVLGGLASGLSSKQVARRLGLTLETVRWYTKRIYAALGVHNRAEATAVAIAAGLVDRHPAIGDADLFGTIAAPIRPIVGREVELERLAGVLRQRRLVSIVGIGGAGKTVLAHEAARRHVGSSAERAVIVLLEHAADETGIALAIGRALDVHLANSGGEVWNDLARSAARTPLLLVLDNVEHLVDHAVRVAWLLEAVPTLRVLTTGRVPFGMAGETVVRLGGLQQGGAVDLFRAEIERLGTSPALDGADPEVVAEICGRLDGLPLAVVLAAAWSDTLSLREIADELAVSSALLVSDTAIPERHRSLDALVDQSIDARGPAGAGVLAKLSTFECGFDRAAAAAVAGASVADLAALVRSSLIRRGPSSDRYDLHPLVRERARARLVRDGLVAAATSAHCAHVTSVVAGFAEAMAGRDQPPRQRDAIEVFDRDHANLRVAFRTATESGDVERASALLDPMVMWLDHHSELLECDAMLTAALATPVADALWPRLVLHREYMRFQSGSVDPSDCRVLDALAELDERGSDWLAPAEVLTGFLEVGFLGRPDSALERARRLAHPDADIAPHWRHRAQMLLGFLLAASGEPGEAVEVHRRGMDDAMRDGDHSAAHVLMFFVAMGLIRINRRDEVASVLANAEQLLTLLPSRQTEACIELVELMVAALDGEDVAGLHERLANPVLAAVLAENRHLSNLAAGALALAQGGSGDGVAARQGRAIQDDDVATGFFAESVVWAELGIALAAAAHNDLDDARLHVDAARPWERFVGSVTSDADVVASVVEAIAAAQRGDHAARDRLVSDALAAPSLFTGLLERSEAVRPLRDLPAQP